MLISVQCTVLHTPSQSRLSLRYKVELGLSSPIVANNFFLLAVHGIDPAAAILTQPNGCTNLYPTPRIRASSSSSCSCSVTEKDTCYGIIRVKAKKLLMVVIATTSFGFLLIRQKHHVIVLARVMVCDGCGRQLEFGPRTQLHGTLQTTQTQTSNLHLQVANVYHLHCSAHCHCHWSLQSGPVYILQCRTYIYELCCTAAGNLL